MPIIRIITRIFFILLFVILFLLSCTDYYCGDGEYVCRDIINTYPYSNPIKYDVYAEAILFESGDLVMHSEYDYKIQTSYQLKELCSVDTICDVAFYDDDLLYRNYSYGVRGVSPREDSCLIIVAPDKCFRWNWGEAIDLEFGNSGNADERLINAVSADINYLGHTYVLDTGDGSMKIYDYQGNFISRWDNINSPRQIKLYYGNIYILTEDGNRIEVYNGVGSLIGYAFENNSFQNINCFAIQDSGYYWVADLNGTRITRIDGRGNVLEEKSEYCFMDISLTFGKIIHLSSAYGIDVLDFENNNIVDFGLKTWYY